MTCVVHSTMALPYDAIAPAASSSQPRSMMRMRAVGAAVALAMVACVALLGAGERSTQNTCACVWVGELNKGAKLWGQAWIIVSDRLLPLRIQVVAQTAQNWWSCPSLPSTSVSPPCTWLYPRSQHASRNAKWCWQAFVLQDWGCLGRCKTPHANLIGRDWQDATWQVWTGWPWLCWSTAIRCQWPRWPRWCRRGCPALPGTRCYWETSYYILRDKVLTKPLHYTESKSCTDSHLDSLSPQAVKLLEENTGARTQMLGDTQMTVRLPPSSLLLPGPPSCGICVAIDTRAHL